MVTSGQVIDCHYWRFLRGTTYVVRSKRGGEGKKLNYSSCFLRCFCCCRTNGIILISDYVINTSRTGFPVMNDSGGGGDDEVGRNYNLLFLISAEFSLECQSV